MKEGEGWSCLLPEEAADHVLRQVCGRQVAQDPVRHVAVHGRREVGDVDQTQEHAQRHPNQHVTEQAPAAAPA